MVGIGTIVVGFGLILGLLLSGLYVAIEMLKLGITAVQDDAFYVPAPEPESIDAVMSAYADAGIRATAALDQPNVVEYEKYPFLRDLLPERQRREMDAAAAPVGRRADRPLPPPHRPLARRARRGGFALPSPARRRTG